MFRVKAVAGLIFDGVLSHYKPSDYHIQGPSSSIDWRTLSLIEPLPLRWEVLRVISKAIQVCFTYFIHNVYITPLGNLDRLHTNSLCGYAGEYRVIQRFYRAANYKLTTKISFFVKRFPIEERGDDVQEKKEHTSISSSSTELATEA